MLFRIALIVAAMIAATPALAQRAQSAATVNRESALNRGLVGWWSGRYGQSGKTVMPIAGDRYGEANAAVVAQEGLGWRFTGSGGGIVVESLQGLSVPGGFTNTGLAYDPDDDCLWCADFDNGKIVKMSKTGALISSFTAQSGIQGIAYDTTRDEIWSANTTTTVKRYDKSGTETASLTLANAANGIAYEEGRDSIWTTVDATSTLKRWDTSGSLQETITISNTAGSHDCLLYDPDDDCLWLTIDSFSIRKINKTTGATITTINGGANIEGLAYDTSVDEFYLNCDQLFHASIPRGNRFYRLAKTADVLPLNSTWDDKFTGHTIAATFYVQALPGSLATIAAAVGGADHLVSIFIRSDGRLSSTVGGVYDRASVIVAGRWYRVVVTHDGATHKIFNNGVQIGSVANPRTIEPIGPLKIGEGLGTFTGIISDVRIWNRVLSPGEVVELNRDESEGFSGTLYGEQPTYRAPDAAGGTEAFFLLGQNTLPPEPYQPTDIDWRCSPFTAFLGALAP